MNEARRKSILAAAARDAELVDQLPAVVATGFGVLALRRLGDVLTVACLPRANKQALRLLREVLDVEVVATPFEHSALHEAIRTAYGDEEVNFPTFHDSAFLEDVASAASLREQKVEDPGPIIDELPADQVCLATLTYRSVLENEDAPREGQALPDPARTRMRLGSIDGGWRVEDGVVHLFSAAPPPAPPAGPVVLTEYRFSEYRRLHAGAHVSEHEVRTRCDDPLPLVVHPSEVQLTGVEEDGSLRFHVYDRTLRFVPGRPGRFDLAYHFLSYGNRMRRTIEVDLHRILCVPRDRLQVHPESPDWKATELARWFGLPETKLGQ